MHLPTDDGNWAVRYPTQLWSAGLDVLIFVALLAVERCGDGRLRATGQVDPRRTWPFNGFLFMLFALLDCLKWLGMEFLRGDALPSLLGPLNLVQLLCLAVVVVSQRRSS
jgi:prolipoprotein diacylglyceryltransferase